MVALVPTIYAATSCPEEFCDESYEQAAGNDTAVPFLQTQKDIYALGVYLNAAYIIISLIINLMMYAAGKKFFRSNADLFEAMGVGTKVGVQRYDVHNATAEDVVEGLADLCHDAIDACDAIVQYCKFVTTQVLISAGSVLGLINTSSSTTILALLWAMAIVSGKAARKHRGLCGRGLTKSVYAVVLLKRCNDLCRKGDYQVSHDS